MSSSSKPLDSVARVLRVAAFNVESIVLPELGKAVIAETPHALVLCVPGEWDSLAATVEEAQAALTNLAARHPSALMWDLYVVVWIDRPASDAEEILRETLEHDTRYARKFILAGPTDDDRAIERALRPLLPLRVPPSVHLADPLAAVRDELLANGANNALVDTAVDSFRDTGEIQVA